MNLLKWSLAALVIVGAAACNTIEGLGEDVQVGGKKLEKAAEKTKQN
ncbi:MAG: entericidin A/B family lipoprotein [Burkholderiaceae bacterium]